MTVPKLGFASTFTQGAGVVCPRGGRDDVLAAIGRESAQAVEEDQIARGRGGGRRRIGTAGPGRQRAAAPVLRPCSGRSIWSASDPRAVGDDDASDGLEQNAILVRYLVARPDEDAAGPVRHVGFDAGGNQSHDLVLQQLPVAGVIFVPDHQVDGESFQPPVGVRLHELAHQIDIGRVGDLQQHDGQIAGNGVAPQAGLAAAVLDENARGRRAARQLA